MLVHHFDEVSLVVAQLLDHAHLNNVRVRRRLFCECCPEPAPELLSQELLHESESTPPWGVLNVPLELRVTASGRIGPPECRGDSRRRPATPPVSAMLPKAVDEIGDFASNRFVIVRSAEKLCDSVGHPLAEDVARIVEIELFHDRLSQGHHFWPRSRVLRRVGE